MTEALSKFGSRKFLVAIATIITLLVTTTDNGTPNTTNLLVSGVVAIAYVISEAFVDHTGNTARLAAAVQSGIRIGAEQASTLKAAPDIVDAEFTPIPSGAPTKADAHEAGS